jgi:hypothetical protein
VVKATFIKRREYMKEKWFIEFTSDFIREFYLYDLDDEGSLRQVAKEVVKHEELSEKVIKRVIEKEEQEVCYG